MVLPLIYFMHNSGGLLYYITFDFREMVTLLIHFSLLRLIFGQKINAVQLLRILASKLMSLLRFVLMKRYIFLIKCYIGP